MVRIWLTSSLGGCLTRDFHIVGKIVCQSNANIPRGQQFLMCISLFLYPIVTTGPQNARRIYREESEHVTGIGGK
jgi:hypothetical protein